MNNQSSYLLYDMHVLNSYSTPYEVGVAIHILQMRKQRHRRNGLAQGYTNST